MSILGALTKIATRKNMRDAVAVNPFMPRAKTQQLPASEKSFKGAVQGGFDSANMIKPTITDPLASTAPARGTFVTPQSAWHEFEPMDHLFGGGIYGKYGNKAASNTVPVGKIQSDTMIPYSSRRMVTMPQYDPSNPFGVKGMDRRFDTGRNVTRSLGSGYEETVPPWNGVPEPFRGMLGGRSNNPYAEIGPQKWESATRPDHPWLDTPQYMRSSGLEMHETEPNWWWSKMGSMPEEYKNQHYRNLRYMNDMQIDPAELLKDRRVGQMWSDSPYMHPTVAPPYGSMSTKRYVMPSRQTHAGGPDDWQQFTPPFDWLDKGKMAIEPIPGRPFGPSNYSGPNF